MTTPRRWCALAVAAGLSIGGMAVTAENVHAQSAFDDLFAPPDEEPVLQPLPPLSAHAIAHFAAGARPRGGASLFGNQVSPGRAGAVQAPRLNELLASGASVGGAVGGGGGSLGVGSGRFVVATESPDGAVTLYVNGEPVTTQGYSRYPTSETRTANYIGRPAWLSEPTFEGGIDEVTLFRRALSAEEVYKLAVTARDAAPKAAATRASSRAVKVGGA